MPQNRMSKRTIESIVKKIADKAGTSKTVSPHVLRDTFAVNKKIKKTGTAVLFFYHLLKIMTRKKYNRPPFFK